MHLQEIKNINFQEKLNIYKRRARRIIILELLQTLEAKTFFIFWRNWIMAKPENFKLLSLVIVFLQLFSYDFRDLSY